MSHAAVTVMIHPSTLRKHKGNREKAIYAMMAPFDEGKEVKSYDRPCWCAGRVANIEAREQAEKELPIDGIRTSVRQEPVLVEMLERFEREYPDGPNDYRLSSTEEFDELWEAALKPREELEKKLVEAHPLRGVADAACTDCKGSGTVKSTYNPRARWDWWVIGGRYEDIKPGENTFALLTPDEGWQERATLGWFGTSRDAKMTQGEWKQVFEAAYAHYVKLGCFAVVVDYHI